MAIRCQTARPSWPTLVVLLCAAAAPLLAAGCQSYAQQDLVAREMRMQEDQLYAMEDYLAQYQQLLCKYRAENAELRRQLGDVAGPAMPPMFPGHAIPAPAWPAPQPTPYEPPRTVPRTPRMNGPQPLPDLELPDVPPLENTNSRGASRPASDAKAAVHDVWLHGEVIENDAKSGPRLVIDVTPLDATGRPADFAGALSLMVLEPDDDGEQQALARWDFAPEDVAAAKRPTAEEPSIRFYLELPEETPIGDSTELWVRLLPIGGEKLLANAEVDLQQPGEFSSLAEKPAWYGAEPEQPVLAAAYSDPPEVPRQVEAEVYDRGWATARPGEPASVSPRGSAALWRMSNEPLAAVAPRPLPPARPPRPIRTASRLEPPKAVAATEPEPVKPVWSPDRDGQAANPAPPSSPLPARPQWSPTR